MLAGAAAGLGLGFLLVIVSELMRGVIHGENAVVRVMGAPPLAVIPIIRGDEEKRGWWTDLPFWPVRREAA